MIQRTMTIEEIFQSYPGKGERLAQIMGDKGLSCVGCSASTWETLEAGMMSHGFGEEEIDALVEELNTALTAVEEMGAADRVTLTPRAALKYQEILKEEGKEGWGLRLGEKAAGCSGFQYFLDYAKEAKEGDLSFVSEGVNIYVKEASKGRLLGVVIDYADGLHGAGFKISNPNVKSSCGCGSSHGY